jgi:hypothetical protein
MNFGSATAPEPVASHTARQAGLDAMRALAIASGIGWSLAFVGVGLQYGLQAYGDGSIFSYAVAVQDAWAIHWHNIAARAFVYLFCLVPAEAYVAATQDAAGGVVLYGFLFFGAQFLGLAVTYAVDRSESRLIFTYACASTACLCPLVFGFPTEMWMAHAMFWPTLALCHHAPRNSTGLIAVSLSVLALVFTHEGALVLTVAIVATLLLRGHRNAAFVRGVGASAFAIAIWFIVKRAFPSDDYISAVLTAAKLNFFNPRIVTQGLFALIIGAFASFAILWIAFRRFGSDKAHIYSGLMVAVGLTGFWLLFDPPLHTENRYFLRTILVLALPCFGALAAIYALAAEGVLKSGPLSRLRLSLTSPDVTRAAAAAVLLVTLVNAVETARFVTAWKAYTLSVRDLVMGPEFDSWLGSPRFVSSSRIDAALQQLSWSSTTPYLAVLIAPNFSPKRLLIDPQAHYFWLPCTLAHAHELAARAIPVEIRRMIRVHACLHR